MGGRPHPREGGGIQEVNPEGVISAAGDPIADEEVPYDENQQGVLELWDEVEGGDTGPEGKGNYEIEEADNEDGHAGALEGSEPPLLVLSRPGFTVCARTRTKRGRCS
jgi:hypothetical protein